MLPYLRWMESSVGASKQASRGGSATVTFTCLEPDFDDLIRIKNPTTVNSKRVDKLDYSVVLNNAFLRRAAKGQSWMLVSVDEAPELYEALYKSEEEFEAVFEAVARRRIKKKVVQAREMLMEIIKQRAETGRIYVFFADNVNRHTPFLDTVYQSNLCQEIFLPTKAFQKMSDLDTGENLDTSELALCFLSSIVAGRVTKEEYEDVAYYTVLTIDNIIEDMEYPFYHNELSAKARRSIGVGITNLAHYLASQGASYSDEKGKVLMHELAERHYYWLARASLRLGKEKGNAEWMHKTKWPEGWLPIDTYAPAIDDIADFKLQHDWETLRADIVENGGIRNSVLTAVAPNESSSLVSNTTNSLYPVRDTMIFKQSQKGNVLFIVPDYDKLKDKYQIAWDVPHKDMAECYGIFTKFMDQGISCDEWVDYTKAEDGKLSYRQELMFILLCAKLGVKSLYYMNSRTKSSSTMADDDAELDIPDEDIPEMEDESGCEACKCNKRASALFFEVNMFVPLNDGVDHINIYTKGKTILGKRLTNLSDDPVTVGVYGTFQCLEGFWYYYLTGCIYPELKTMNGFQAKKFGKGIRDDRIDKDGLTNDQKEVLKEAIRSKLRQNKDLLRLLIQSDLPLAHYYFYGKEDNPKVHYLSQYDWIVEEIERIRKVCKEYYGNVNRD